MQRKIFDDFTLLNGQVLKPGDNVFFPIRAVLSDPQLYYEPDKFNPDRFLDKAKSKSVAQTATQTKQYSV